MYELFIRVQNVARESLIFCSPLEGTFFARLSHLEISKIFHLFRDVNTFLVQRKEEKSCSNKKRTRRASLAPNGPDLAEYSRVLARIASRSLDLNFLSSVREEIKLKERKSA
jgi:hypothetical protein